MKRAEYISNIAPIIVKYCNEYGYKVASPIIAQAICEGLYWDNNIGASVESVLAEKYHNYFGMKCGDSWTGASVNLATMEEYTVGVLTQIQDNFRAYANMDEGVKGYFEFIQYPRYANLKTTSDAFTYITYLKQDGYATSSQYVDLLWNIIRTENLTEWDKKINATVKNISSEYTSNPKIVFCSGKPKGFDQSIAGSYRCIADILNVRDDAGMNKKILISIFENTDIWCNGFYSEADGMKWGMIQFYGLDGTVYCGFSALGDPAEPYFERI